MNEVDEKDVNVELDRIKDIAKMMNINHSPNIGLEALKSKIRDSIEKNSFETEPSKNAYTDKRTEAKRLIRCRVTCMNPLKSGWEGDIFSAGSTKLGSEKKFIPFNSIEGVHIPKILLDVLLEKKIQLFVSSADRNGLSSVRSKEINEYAIEILPNLTRAELIELARKQSMSRSLEGE